MLWNTDKGILAGVIMSGCCSRWSRPRQENTPVPLILGKEFETLPPLHAAEQYRKNDLNERSLLMFTGIEFLHGKTSRPYDTRDLFTSRVLRGSAAILY